MIQINEFQVKSWLFKNWSYLLNGLLVVMVWLLIGVSDSKDGIIAELKNNAKEYIASANKYVAENNELKGKLVLLEQQKQKVKTQIVYVENKTKSDVKKVTTLNTKQIANYYQERYKLPIIITKYGVLLSDTIAKKNIVELIEKDGCFKEVDLFKTQLQLEEKKGIVKDTIIGNLGKANIDLHKAIFTQDKIIDKAEKSLRKEKRKKTFWKVVTGTVITVAGYLFITQ